MHILRHCSRCFLLLAFALPAAASAPRYSVNVIAGPDSSALDINLSGQVVGQNGSHAFFHDGYSLIHLGSLGGPTSKATAINDAGLIGGSADNAMGNEIAFRYSMSGMEALGTLGGEESRVYGINNSGVLVGASSTGIEDDYGLLRAFVYNNGVMQNIGMLPGGDMSRAHGINSTGQVVGTSTFDNIGPPYHPSHAFLYSNGVMSDLGTLGGLYSSGEAINDDGWIVGQASTDVSYGAAHTVPRAFLYVNGVMSDLGAFGDMFAASGATDINNLGQVVGWADTVSNLARHAFLYQNGTLFDLNLLIDPALGWTIHTADAINDMQQIAATGCKDGQCYALRLDMITAVPEPKAYLLLLIGLGLLGFASRREQAAPF